MRRASAWFLALLVLLVFAVPVHAEAGVRVLTNGMIAHFDNTITENGRVLLPLTDAANLFGLKVAQSATDQKITLTREGTTIVLVADAPKAQVNGKDVTLDVPVRTVNGQTYVPLRFLAEATDTVAGWNQADQLIKLTPVRSFLDQAKVAGQGDLTTTGNFNINFAMSGVPGLSITMGIKMDLVSQTYKGDSLTKLTLDLDGDSMVMEEAVVGGKTYTRDSSVGKWQLADPKAVGANSGLESFFGEADIMKLGTDLLNASKVSLAGTAEKDGVKLVKVKVDIATADLERVIKEVLGPAATGGLAGDAPALNLKVDHYTFTFWVDPDTLIMHHFDLELAATFSDEDMSADVTMKGAFDATPLTTPIQFPADLPK